jgi:hypothetical protein
MTDQFEPSLGYNDTSGHQAAEPSAEGVRHADVTGITAKAQKYALIMATQGGRNGVTVAELRERHGSLHHGRISAALTNLHKAGRLAALRERRGHCGIYVLPEFVEGREVREFRSNRPQIDREELVTVLTEHRPAATGVAGWRCVAGDWEGDNLIRHGRHLADVIIEEFGR